MGVDGGEVSLTNYGRTRDSRFRLIFNRSDVPASCIGRDSFPFDKSKNRTTNPKLNNDICFISSLPEFIYNN
jgi:hypothetical protein